MSIDAFDNFNTQVYFHQNNNNSKNSSKLFARPLLNLCDGISHFDSLQLISMTDLRLQIEPGILPTQKDLNLHFNEQIQQIGLRVNKRDKKDYQQLFRILNEYLSYPDSSEAEKHRNANKLGELDLKERKQRNMRETYIRVDNEICNCCGFFLKKEELNCCQEGIIDVNSIGSSTVVFFQTFKNIAVLLLIMVLFYSIFAFATNISVAKDSKSNGSLDYLAISLGAKANSSKINDNSNTFYLASSWLGVAMLGFWLIALIKMKKDTKKLQNQSKGYTSVSDFSVVIQKMPTGYKREQIQAMMDEYFIKIAPKDIEFRQLKVEKYNEAKPFYFNQDEFNDEELEQAQQQLRNIKQEMVQWIAERIEEEEFSSTPQYRELQVKALKDANKKIQQKKQELIEKIVKKLEEKEKKTTTFVFITFETVQQRNFFLSYNNNSIFSKIKKLFPCFDTSNKFSVQNQHLIIENAPQPQDINWGNIGFGDCESIWRKCVTAFATLIMLGISFVIVYGLSTVQDKNKNQRSLSILISLVISVINLIIIKVIQYLTIFEKLYTNNTFQISLAYKSILAQLLNSIFIPIIVSIYIKSNNVYGESGLTEDIFILAISSSFFPPLVRLIDPYYIYVYLKYNYYNRPMNKICFTQYELNLLAEKPEFELGLEYIYLISNFLFTCFFVSLQPIIPLFALLGLLVMYWIEKYALFNKSQRPIPGIDTINIVMHHMIYFGGIAYALGSLTWAVFLDDRSFRNSLVANLVAAGLGLLIFVFPYDAFVNYKENSHNKKTYDSRRIYFPAEYDRLNPVTKKEGIREYKEFLLRKKEQIDGFSSHMQEDIAAKLLHLTQNNTHKGTQHFGKQEAAAVARQLFINETRNIIDPKLLKSFLLPQRPREHNLELYASNIEMMNRNYSQRDVDRQAESVVKTYHNPYEQEMKLSQHNYSFADKNKDDNFMNIYKSTLNLDNLGLASNQELRASRNPYSHPPHPHHESK